MRSSPARLEGDASVTPLSSRILPRDWTDVFLIDGAARGGRRATAEPEPEQRRGFLRRLRENLSKTREALAAEVQATLFDTLDDETWERLEEALIMADVGASTTAAGRREARARGDERRADAAARSSAPGSSSCSPSEAATGEPRIDLRHKPTVIMVAGVNGTGKTTTIGKLAWHLRRRAGPDGRARRCRHVPRRRRRAARRVGRSARAARS